MFSINRLDKDDYYDNYEIGQELYEHIERTDSYKGSSAVNTLSFDTLEHSFLLAGYGDSSIKIWDIDTNKPLGEIKRKMGHEFGVSAIEWWPYDNGLFISASFDKTVKIWDAASLMEAYSFDMECRVYCIDVAKTREHSLVACASDHPFVRLIDLRTTSSTHTLYGHSGKVLSVKWSPKDPYLLATAGSDGTVRMWDIRRSSNCLTALDLQQTGDTVTRTPMEFRRAHRAAVNGLCWFPSGDYILSLGNDDKMRLWDLSFQGGKNTLVNFGPRLRNKHSQTLDPCLSSVGDLAEPYVFFPSDSGHISMLKALEGKEVKIIERERSAKKAGHIDRTACFVGRGVKSMQYFGGSLDGSITKYEPVIYEDQDDEVEKKDPTVLDKIWDSMQFSNVSLEGLI